MVLRHSLVKLTTTLFGRRGGRGQSAPLRWAQESQRGEEAVLRKTCAMETPWNILNVSFLQP